MNNGELLTSQNHNVQCLMFFLLIGKNKILIEVANNLPFAKFYIACIQTHHVHKYVMVI